VRRSPPDLSVALSLGDVQDRCPTADDGGHRTRRPLCRQALLKRYATIDRICRSSRTMAELGRRRTSAALCVSLAWPTGVFAVDGVVDGDAFASKAAMPKPSVARCRLAARCRLCRAEAVATPRVGSGQFIQAQCPVLHPYIDLTGRQGRLHVQRPRAGYALAGTVFRAGLLW